MCHTRAGNEDLARTGGDVSSKIDTSHLRVSSKIDTTQLRQEAL